MTTRNFPCPYCGGDLSIAVTDEKTRISVACGACLGVFTVDSETLQVTFKADRTHYEVLGVCPTAGDAQIKKHYRLLIQRFHPDHSTGNSAIARKIIEAYTTLRDRGKRRLYDMQVGTVPVAAAAAAPRRYAAPSEKPVTPARHVFRNLIFVGALLGLLVFGIEIVTTLKEEAAAPLLRRLPDNLERFLPPEMAQTVKEVRGSVEKFYGIDEDYLKKLERGLVGQKEEQRRW